jgi:hypothetical protein
MGEHFGKTIQLLLGNGAIVRGKSNIYVTIHSCALKEEECELQPPLKVPRRFFYIPEQFSDNYFVLHSVYVD